MALSWLALLVERHWSRLLPLFCLLGLFASLAFFGLFGLGGLIGHVALLLIFFAMLVWQMVQIHRQSRLPEWAEARRRLERSAPEAHRPVTTLQDKPIGSEEDPVLAALWHRHQEAARARLDRLHVTPAATDSARRDRLALRALVLLILVTATVSAWDRWPDRLSFAILPDIYAYGLVRTPQLDLWLTPPDYTGLPPRTLASGALSVPRDLDKDNLPQVSAPQGSILSLRYNGRGRPPVLRANQDEFPLQSMSQGGYVLDIPLETGAFIVVQQGRKTLGAWALTLSDDSPPEIAFSDDPSGTEHAALRLAYEGQDDFGITALTLHIHRRMAEEESGASPPPLVIPLSLSGRSPREIRGVNYQDLAPHPWAGLPVTVQLLAEDALGQRGRSEAFDMILPERTFRHPIARRLIAMRKTLNREGLRVRGAVAAGLDDIGKEPEAFENDIAVFIGLRVAVNRLMTGRDEQSITESSDLLWDMAVHLEQDALGEAEERLARAEQKLQDLLSDPDSTDAEIREATRELEDALQNYFAALAQDLQQRMRSGEIPQIDVSDLSMESIDLDSLMAQLREYSEIGAREAAQEMLRQLSEMTQGLRAQSGLQIIDPEMQAQAMELLRHLQRIIETQRQLLDDTNARLPPDSFDSTPPAQHPQGMIDPVLPGDVFERLNPDLLEALRDMDALEEFQNHLRNWQDQQSTSGESPQEGESGTQSAPDLAAPDLAESQQDLRRDLGQFMLDAGALMPQIPDNLGEAEGAMRRAESGLQSGELPAAMKAQREALAALSDSAQSIVQFMTGGARMISLGRGQQQMRRPSGGRDPFGREGGREMSTRDVQIPKESDVQRAREILRELRNRAGDFRREQDELDYLRRLMDRF